MTANELKDILPTSEGATRRRLMSGFMVAVAMVPLLWSGSIDELLKSLGAKDTTVAIGILLSVYAIGLLIEIAADSMLVRAFGGGLWAAEFPLRSVNAETAFARWILRALVFYVVVPFYAYYGILRGLLGTSLYRYDTSQQIITPQAEALHKALPEFVRRGLQNPFGDEFEAAWEKMLEGLGDVSRKQMSKQLVRNREMLSIVSALLLIAVIYVFCSTYDLDKSSSVYVISLASWKFNLPTVAIPLVILTPVGIVWLHHRYLLATVTTALELLVLDKGAH